jgi:hypothetical protein
MPAQKGVTILGTIWNVWMQIEKYAHRGQWQAAKYFGLRVSAVKTILTPE